MDYVFRVFESSDVATVGHVLIKESGYGRELSSYGIREFVNIKPVLVA
jgi:acyl-CoA reductase-like NAD-dependent aldehyde dehydrogenase